MSCGQSDGIAFGKSLSIQSDKYQMAIAAENVYVELKISILHDAFRLDDTFMVPECKGSWDETYLFIRNPEIGP